jgi:ABC-type transport system involved in multi-copper enzyme maturation permease subunit
MTGALTWARLSFRQQRWELILVALGVAATAAAMVYFASALDGMRAASPDCIGVLDPNLVTEAGPPVACQAILTAYNDAQNWGSQLVNLAWAAPFGMGVLLGAPLVAREIDGGTAQLAWSLSRSRVSWLLRRIAFVTLFGLALLALLAVLSNVLTAAMMPGLKLGEDFTYFGRRDLPVVARGFGAIMLGVLVGALIGRVLPAILASALVIGVAFAGVSLGMDQWNRSMATLVPRYNMVEQDSAALGVEYGIQTADGQFMSYDEAYASGLTLNLGDENGKWYASEEDFKAGRSVGQDTMLVIAGEWYPALMLRDSAAAVVLGLVALAGTALVVTRRRPN